MASSNRAGSSQAYATPFVSASPCSTRPRSAELREDEGALECPEGEEVADQPALLPGVDRAAVARLAEHGEGERRRCVTHLARLRAPPAAKPGELVGGALLRRERDS